MWSINVCRFVIGIVDCCQSVSYKLIGLARGFRDHHRLRYTMTSSHAFIKLRIYRTFTADPLDFDITRFYCSSPLETMATTTCMLMISHAVKCDVNLRLLKNINDIKNDSYKDRENVWNTAMKLHTYFSMFSDRRRVNFHNLHPSLFVWQWNLCNSAITKLANWHSAVTYNSTVEHGHHLCFSNQLMQRPTSPFYISRMADTGAVKFCTQGEYIKSKGW